ncbi:MAG: hypothetical protein U9O59_06045 [Actinomycetota bacterium]|nr:hypothetical protein [Actinomycetota bacterium]
MADSGKILKNQEKIHDILPNGQKRFAKGNKIGKMKKRGFTLTDLNKVVVEYEKTHNQTLLKHYIEQLMVDNNLLSKFIDKNVPTKNINEVTGADGSPFQVTLKKVVYKEDEGAK